MSVNERIKTLRHFLKLSQIQFAKAVYISNGYLAEIELGNRRVNERLIHLISSIFGVNKGWLQTGEGRMLNTAAEHNLERITTLFKALNPEFQDYVLKQIDQLLDLQNHGISEGTPERVP
ncbi:MAG: helix-turn-helix domain-containing protein [Spirochaetaceae bacterium]|jgi:transcriptional regulator with XRE-family HTH domain|nr:helix-turn-helix domain-containing protein [Spirochaetaceae bacterium]